ncbi:MAG: hypothetical protein QNJ78_12935 [Gammaproteobacteria bacterium]|nr:hypothetical protein [Gammaproteobacteria bacterium]
MNTHSQEKNGTSKRIIGVIAGHDTPERSNQLVRLFHSLFESLENGVVSERHDVDWFFEHYHFVFTGGTFARLMLGIDPERKEEMVDPRFDKFVREDCKEQDQKHLALLAQNSTLLPPYFKGGVILLSQLVVQRQCSIIWYFLTPFGSHWIIPENLALLRLCDFNNVKKQMNYGSALEWIKNSMVFDSSINLTGIPLNIWPGCERGYEKKDSDDSSDKSSDKSSHERIVACAVKGIDNYAKRYLLPNKKGRDLKVAQNGSSLKDTIDDQLAGSVPYCITIPSYKKPRPESCDGFSGTVTVPWYPENRKERTIALIAHDEMKDRMVNFAIDYEDFLIGYQRIVTTGTTGDKIRKGTRKIYDKLDPCFSGPKGGDIEIATQVLFGRIHTVVFFVDPSSPHAHIDDIRVVFGACMINPEVRMLTNEQHARQRVNDVIRAEGRESKPETS